jgi:hypothetical protein
MSSDANVETQPAAAHKICKTAGGGITHQEMSKSAKKRARQRASRKRLLSPSATGGGHESAHASGNSVGGRASEPTTEWSGSDDGSLTVFEQSSLADRMAALHFTKKVPKNYSLGPLTMPKGSVEIKVDGKDFITIHRPIGLFKGSVRPDWAYSYTKDKTDLEADAALTAFVRDPVSEEDIVATAQKLGLLTIADGAVLYTDGRNRAKALARASADAAAANKAEEKKFSAALATWNALPKGKGAGVPKKPKRTASNFKPINFLNEEEAEIETAIKEISKMMRQAQDYPDVGGVQATTAAIGQTTQFPVTSLQGVSESELVAALRHAIHGALTKE